MPRFLVTHSVKTEDQEQVVAGARAVAGALPEGVLWLNSWWAPDTLKLICEWDAPGREDIERVCAPISTLFPVEAIREVEWIDPKWYMPASDP
jgi:hypothetical protein